MASYTFSTFSYPGSVSTFGGGINISGQFGGRYDLMMDDDGNALGYVDSNGTATSISIPQSSRTEVTGINNQGQFVGDYDGADNKEHGFLDSNNVITTIDVPNSTGTAAAGINSSGTIVGVYQTVQSDTPPAFGFVDTGGSFASVIFPGAYTTLATGINAQGTIVGEYASRQANSSSGIYSGFIDQNGTFTPINYPGATSTQVNGINDLGQVVDTYNSQHGFLYFNGAFTAVDVPNAAITEATGINNAGQISGDFSNTGGSNGFAAFVATPVACFCTGTLIRTARGEVAVESLRVGDLAITASGALGPVRWIGHRDLAGEGRALPHDQQPIRIRAGAFGRDALGSDLPRRDLLLSPGHPVLVGADAENEGGHLVPVMCLVNGTTVERVAVESVTYWHVELDAHDILLAEGLPAESYLDWGDRAFFTQADHRTLANPDFVVPGLAGRCRLVALDGPVVEAERLRLDAVFAASLVAQCGWDDMDDASLVAA